MTRGTMRSLLRGWMRINRHDRYGRAGFVLPTVAMVLLVVVLLTITIMFRSMDRAKMAQYRRVDEQVLQAATPALDRAREKIKYLLSGNDKSLPRETPSDNELNRALNDVFYDLGDEERLQIQYDVDDVAGITVKNGTNFKPLEDQDAIQTAWRFPVDTNNDGKFDSFTYYGIFFRKPGTNRTRNPLDARTPPMTLSSGVTKECQAILSSGGTSTLVDDSGWSRTDGNLKKAFFVYTTTVPITEADITAFNLDTTYSFYKGTPSFSALEYQVDVSRVPLTNNAVVYEDDLIITPIDANLNGRIFTNSNLIVSHFGNLTLYQVSGINSCFYREENSKIIVAGNVLNGMTDQVKPETVGVHLYQGAGTNPNKDQTISTTNQSVSTAVNDAMYDDAAYKARLKALIDDLRATTGDKEIQASNMPPSLEAVVQKRLTEDSTLKPDTVREEQLRAYFKARIRKVTQVEDKTIPAGTTTAPVAIGLGTEDLRPATDTWMLPTNAAGTGSTSGVTFIAGQLEQTEPETQKTNGKENYLGDRVVAGNNLPALKYDSTINPPWKTARNLPVGAEKWTDPNTVDRTRSTQVKALPNLGDTKRDGYWEKAAAQKPKAPLDSIGGLRVITGAGVYEPRNSFLPRPRWASTVDTYDDPATSATETFPIVWPDTMPMSPVTGVGGVQVYDNSGSDSWATLPTTLPAAKTPTIDPNTPQYAKGDLRMRASVVYHYSSDFYDPANDDTDQQPIACVSSYYDPTNRITAKNSIDVDGGFGKDTTNGKSNNGVAYPKPTTARPTSASYSSTTGLYTVSGGAAELGTQANYVFPDGRFANPALRDALKTLVDGDDLTLANQAAIDSTLCSLDILSGDITPSDTVIPHGAISEATLLNAREVKANEPDDTSTTVDETFTLSSPPNTAQKAKLNARATLPLEERMPQEVRVTRIDLGALRNQEITQGVTTGPKTSGGKEYLLPFSGIIYASRDDALPDLSAQPNTLDTPADLEESAADLKLDPTRRPNGILLANGAVLKRPLPASPTVQEVVQDKGLTLVSNLPVYVQGNFNKHTQQEFTGTFSWTFADYYGRPASALNPNFACHAGDPRIQAAGFKCDTGDDWRPANVLADAITLLSDNFRFGYRDEGDFDLRNNAGSPIIKGYDLNGDGIISATAGYDLNGDGIISATAGYDFNRNGKIDDTDPTVDEATYNLDLNKDEDKTDTGLKETEVLFMGRIGHDLNGNGTISALDPAGDETKYGFDLNGDGDKTDTAVKETEVNFVMKYDETKYDFDFNNDGNKTDTGVMETDVLFKFRPPPVTPTVKQPLTETLFPVPAAFDETKYGIDLNGDGDKTDTAVKETDIVITAKMARQLNGFLNNDYAINGLSSGGPTGRFADTGTSSTPTDENYRSTTGTILNSSYFNNFVTPIQRRLDPEKNSTTGVPKPNTNDPKEFLTEICLKLPVSACGTGDWSVIAFGGSVIPTRNLDNTVVPVASLLSGTTATPPAAQYQRFPRRVAFRRNPTNQMILNSNLPTPLGVTAAGDITNVFANIRNNQNNTLWFQTRNGNNRNTNGANPLWYYNPEAPTTSVSTFVGLENKQPLLVPILQIHATNSTTISTATETNATKIFPVGDNPDVKNNRWGILAGTTEFNLVMATGDIPVRPGDNNGGLQNLPRFLENWQFPAATSNIAGAFIQTNRSSYGSAPYLSLMDENATYTYGKRPPGIFGNAGNNASRYRSNAGGGKIGYFLPPTRNWGFDVGLLSQPPDLFAQKFSLTDETLAPDEYFREVSRDDDWIQGLLCSKVVDPTKDISTTKAIPSQVCDAKYGG
ncbi:hypothetical protein IQ236_15345 [Planktothrix mougeotii LEGE 06226]|uniref:Uncharacterized protein n=2 Tax=Planktothrix mougeotii TaxID=54306 RepID=A0ABR9UG97_9CYAN|nr:hypothetical protein [Planktothrix mougeotii LEGE 06226]